MLSGGGSKGAYEIGVWKALRKLKIKYDIVTGTSVGALNGAFMVQDDYKSAETMWQNLNFNMVFTDKFDEDIHTISGFQKLTQMYGKGILKGGLDVQQLEDTIEHYIDIDKFYNSKIDYGLVTVNLSSLKPLLLIKKNIPKELLKDYLMASATCFPAFKKKQIGNEYYVDGGYYDNMPIELAKKLGATEVVAVDIGGKKIFPINSSNFNIPITYIKPHSDLGSFLIFDQKLAIRNMKLGYNDTMKIYKKYEGIIFTFHKGELDKLISTSLKDMQREIRGMFNFLNQYQHSILNLQILKEYEMLLEDEEKLRKVLLEIVDILGQNFSLDETVIYRKKNYIQEIQKKYHQVEENSLDKMKQFVLTGKLNKAETYDLIIKYGYKLFQKALSTKILKSILFLKKELLATLYLKIILAK